MTNFRWGVLMAALILLAASGARAQGGPANGPDAPADGPVGPSASGGPAGPGNGPCKADFEKFCKDVQPGGGRIVDCMKQHHDELSAECRQSFDQKAAAIKGRFKRGIERAKQACQADIDKFCKGVEPGEGRIAKCLEPHRNELSDSCKAVAAKIDAYKERRQKRAAGMGTFEQACGDDVKKLCADVEPGHGSIIACLRQHRDQLSDSCKALWKGRGPGRAKPPKAQQEPTGEEGSSSGSGGESGDSNNQ